MSDKLPPYNEEAERAVLGSLVLDFDKVFDLAQESGVSEESFFVPAHAEIWKAFCEMNKDGVAVDIRLICDKLKSMGKMEIVGGDSFIEKIVDGTPTSAHAEYYIGVLSDYETRRKCLSFSRKLSGIAYNLDEPIDRVIEYAQSITANVVKEESSEIKDIADRSLQEWEDAERNGFVGAPSGWKSLNKYLGGYRYGWVTAVGGYQGQGKSLYACNEALSMAKAGIPVLIISLEMTAEQVVQRIIGNIGEFSTFKRDLGKATEDEKSRAKEAAEIVKELPIFVRSGNFSAEKITQMMRFYVKNKGVKVVFIDYIQLVSSHKKQESRTRELDYISRTLSLATLGLKCATILFSQFSRDAQKKGEVPRLDSFRDCGSIENDARQCILIYQKPDFPDTHIFEIAKNNMGPYGSVEMKRVGNRQRWQEEERWYSKEEEQEEVVW